MSETPDWAKGAVSTLNPTAKAQAKPTEDRIASTRARGMARSKDSNADSNSGFNHPASYWQDFAGHETSAWDAAVLVCLAGILESPILKRSKFV